MIKNSSLHGKTILVVHTGLEHKKFIFPKLKRMGLKVVAAHKEKTSIDNYVDHWILTDLNDQKTTLRNISSFLKRNPGIKIDGVVTFWEESTLITAKIAERLNLIGIPYEVVLKTRNKFQFREFCHQSGIRAPQHKILLKRKDLDYVIKKLAFPVVVKPVYGSSSAFVIKVEEKKDLKEIVSYVKNNVATHPDSAEWDDLSVMAEEYIDGDEVDIDILMQNGKIKFYSISDNYQTNEPFFVEVGQAIPSTLPEKNQTELIEMAEEVLEKLGILNGVIHFEAKSSSHGPVPIEVNVRMGGDETYSFVKNAWGVDLVENAVKIALGGYIKINKPALPKKYLSSHDFLAEHSGVLSQLYIDQNLKKMKNLGEIHFEKKTGDICLVPPDGYEYLGWITCWGKSLKESENYLEEAKAKISYKIAEFRTNSSIGKTERKNRFSAAFLNKRMIWGQVKIKKIRNIKLKDLRSLHVGIAGNTFEGDSGASAVELELMSVGNLIEKTLKDKGYQVSFFDFNNLSKVFNDLRKSKVDLVFNVCERINDSSLLEPHAVAMFDMLQIPYTGSNPFTLALCIDKIRVKKLLNFHNIPTAKWDYAYNMDDEIDKSLNYPLIVKPGNTDNSIGIDNDSVVTNPKELKIQLEKVIIGLGRPAIIEEYLDGDEYDISIMGDEEDELKVLPLSRSIFNNMEKGQWHIYIHEDKFGNHKPEDRGIVVQRPPKRVNKKLISLISEMALDTYNILDCHDYGRVEVKVDKDNNPYILELNPNPSININDCVPSVAKIAGMDYGEFLEEIIKMTIRRYKNKPPYYHLQANLI